jgi:uncharacterized protein (TIGR02646 family)
MLKVDRSSVPTPVNLENLTEEQKSHLIDYNKISHNVYGHNNVKSALKKLYGDKCYICECKVGDSYDVEHFLPKKHFLHLAYTWSNLHKACTQCNLAKESNPFLVKDITDSKKVIDILLLDPSAISYNIYDYISSDINGKVILKSIGTDPSIKEKAQVTAEYLNGELKKSKNTPFQHAINVFLERKDRILSFERTLVTFSPEVKENAIKINSTLTSYCAQQNDSLKQLDIETYNFLTNIEMLYLNKDAEYCSFIRNCTINSLSLTYESILAVIAKLRTIYSIS